MAVRPLAPKPGTVLTPTAGAKWGRRWQAAALAALAAGATWAALRPEPAAPAGPPPAAIALWSPARVPALMAETQGTVELEAAVDDLLGELSACVVVHEGDRQILTRRAELPLTPASTQKILVGAAALSILGEDFRYETKVVARERPRDGEAGTLWLVGGGDPHLATPEYAAAVADRLRTQDRPVTSLAALADDLVAAGVRSVAEIRGDDSRYDRTRAVPSWKPNYVTDNEAGPLGALLVDSGFPRFTFPVTRADNPAVHAAAELTALLVARGVTVAGPPASGVAPPQAVSLARVRSAPLSEVVAAMVRESDNTAAELIVREVGRARSGVGSTSAGTAAIEAELAALGLPTKGLNLEDGSGLDVGNTVSCELLGAALRDVEALAGMLAVAGESGTLAHRLDDTRLDGRLAGKTGSLRGVTGLAGFLEGRRRLSFAFLAAGDFSASQGRVLQDRLVALLADYPGPQPEEL